MISRTNDPNDWTDADVQRDPSSEMAGTAMRIRPDQLKQLYAIDTWRSLLPLAGNWALIFAAVGIAIASHSALVWIIAAILVGRSQHALAVLMHDAAHFRLLEDRKWNDFVGQWLCAFPIASNLYAYRNVHLRHHRYLLTDRDPDLSLSRGYPVTWESFKRKLVRDALGVSSMVMRGYVTVEEGRPRLSRGNLFYRLTPANVARRAAAAAFIAILFYLGYGWAFLGLWVAPLITVNQVILRVRGVLEHAVVPDPANGLQNARTIVSDNPVARFMLNPHHVSYHLEHHLFPAVPHYNLPALHRSLATDPRFGDALVERSYAMVLRSMIRPSRKAAAATGA